MNKIVLEHYPVSKLPEDMRQGFDTSATVKIVIEADVSEDEKWPGFANLPKRRSEPLSIEELFESIRKYRETNPPVVTTEEAVARIRALRDEWDDE